MALNRTLLAAGAIALVGFCWLLLFGLLLAAAVWSAVGCSSVLLAAVGYCSLLLLMRMLVDVGYCDFLPVTPSFLNLIASHL